MYMKKLSIFLLALIFGAGTIFADGIKVGDIWYNFDAEHLTAEVTFQGAYYSSSNEYSGEVVIPSSVTYSAQTYSVTSIGEQAFSECTGLTSVTIPNSVTSIGYGAFWDCSGLTSVTIGNSVTSIGASAFSGCSGLTSVTIPNSVTILGNYAFKGCSALTSVAIPNSVTSIGDGAFYLCSGLTSVTIPNSVTSIGSIAFQDCTVLTSVTNYATTPQEINNVVFNNVNKSTCKLFVPQAVINAYRAAANWSAFSSIGAIMTANEDAGTYYSTFFDGSVNYILPAGVEAYAAIAVSEDVLNLTKVAGAGEIIPANEGFILVSSVPNYKLEATSTYASSGVSNILTGSDVAIATPANCYVLSKGSDGVGFYQYSGANVGAHKAYLTIAPKAGAPRRLRFSFSETNATTAVDQVQGNKVQGTKILENGQLYIMYNGVKYNVQGQVVK